MIPSIVHYVWVGPKKIPDEDLQRIEGWRKQLPNWEIRAWGNENVDFSSRYLRQAYSVRAWNRVSDYTRMDALARFGGVYLDVDVDLIKSLDPLLSLEAFAGFQAGDELPEEMVNGAILGAEPNHWLPTSIRRYFNERLDGRANLGSFSGPGLLTQVLRERGLGRYSDSPLDVDGVTLFPKRYFYPYSWKEVYSESVIMEDTYAVHRWAETWVAPGLRARGRRKLLALASYLAPELSLQLSRLDVRRRSGSG